MQEGDWHFEAARSLAWTVAPLEDVVSAFERYFSRTRISGAAVIENHLRTFRFAVDRVSRSMAFCKHCLACSDPSGGPGRRWIPVAFGIADR